MAGDTCERKGCLEPGEIGGLCVSHYNEDYNRRYRPDTAESNKRFLEEERAVKEIVHCKDCGKEITRAFIGRCRKCFNVWDATRKNPPGPKTKAGGGETDTPEPETKEPVLTKERCQIGKKNPGEKGADEEITVTVDFTRYPKIHKSLLELAEKEFRTPASQLLYLLHDHLEGLEEKASKQEGAADGR